jgi:predicted cytidylate kinase
MIKICLGGLTSTGKTTVGEAVAKELDIAYITKELTETYKKLVEQGFDLVDKDRNITSEPKYASQFEKDIVKLSKDRDCVITTWLGPWFVEDATLKVLLKAGEQVRAERTAKREDITVPEALKVIKSKDGTNVINFKKDYKIDIMDPSIFDFEINTERFTVKQLALMIAALALVKEKGKFW